MSCELVISGWYASTERRTYLTAGDDLIRDVSFRPLWWRSVDTFAQPENVFIVDSASPVKSNDAAYTSTRFQNIELLINPGHSQNGKTHYSGYMAGVMLGLEFALFSDVDMVIYVEQDALLYGSGLVDKIKNSLRRRDLVFGAGGKRSIQQSVFAATKRGIRDFLRILHSINYSDKQVAPEHKFMFAGSRIWPSMTAGLAQHTDIRLLRGSGLRLFSMLCALSRNYEILPFGYGRARPIHFGDEVFYFQHGTADEVARYKELTGF